MSNTPPKSAKLIIEKGPWRGQRYPLTSPILIGRALECDVTLEDAQVSRKHARLYWENSQLMIEDLGSANGTLVNGTPITEPHPLNIGDKIEIGESTLGAHGLMAGRDQAKTVIPRHRGSPSSASSSPAPIPPPPPPTPAPPPDPPAAKSSSNLWLIIAGIGLLLLILVAAAGLFFWVFRAPTPEESLPPIVTLTDPVSGAEIEVGETVNIRAAATDNNGVVRAELWADNTRIAQQNSASTEGQSPLLINFSWTPETVGNHLLEIRAYNVENLQSEPVVLTLNAVEGIAEATTEIAETTPPTDEPTPTTISAQVPPTFTPNPTTLAQERSLVVPTPNIQNQRITLQATSGVNVRTGPGTTFENMGALNVNEVTEVTGRNANSSWWQIVYPLDSDQRGWVSTQYVQISGQVTNVPVVEVTPPPSSPTPVPTNTPEEEPTPEPTTEEATTEATTEPTETAVPAPEVEFTVDNPEIEQGECTNLRWKVKNVSAYFVNGAPQAGDEGHKGVCPEEGGVTEYSLTVETADGNKQEFTVRVTVR